MSMFKIETQVEIVITTMAIHNLIKRNAEMNIDFDRCQNINLNHNDYSRVVNLVLLLPILSNFKFLI